MGTTYHIKVVSGYFRSTEDLKDKIDARLKEINRSMSTYMKESEISRFNALENTEEKFHISDDFFQVMLAAKHLHKITGGAWDGTLDPLINLWGFGRSGKKSIAPDPGEIRTVLEDIGFDHIEISEDKYLRKKKISVSLDLASVAKGYGVDQIAHLLEKEGFGDFLVEIGGEVSASGLRKDGKQWRVGINMPRKTAGFSEVYKALNLYNSSLATSGDYRNFFEADGKRYSHVLNPRTGYPVANGVVSVSVIADTCTFADGLATALMVMGHEKGLELVNNFDNIECLIVVEEEGRVLRDYYSRGFEAD
ncbi:FAD:protein FMN transferase [Desulfococcaceae bacterium HSG8]|nr:FAD:protein FMN transferase [Desulfococcaceae bacterium HSG8]